MELLSPDAAKQYRGRFRSFHTTKQRKQMARSKRFGAHRLPASRKLRPKISSLPSRLYAVHEPDATQSPPTSRARESCGALPLVGAWSVYESGL